MPLTDWTSNQYYNDAVQAAQRFGVPVDLFIQQIGQESSFNPTAQNGLAYGIAQFIPSTASLFKLNTSDPIASLNAAAQYDAQLYKKTGSWAAALTAYGTTANGDAPDVLAMAQSYDNPSWLQSFLRGTADVIGNATKGANYVAGGAAQAVTTAGDVASGTVSLLKIITDIPRMTTMALGLILIIAGIFALARGPAVQIVTGAAKEALTS